jgi:hypothetical protein
MIWKVIGEETYRDMITTPRPFFLTMYEKIFEEEFFV